MMYREESNRRESIIAFFDAFAVITSSHTRPLTEIKFTKRRDINGTNSRMGWP